MSIRHATYKVCSIVCHKEHDLQGKPSCSTRPFGVPPNLADVVTCSSTKQQRPINWPQKIPIRVNVKDKPIAGRPLNKTRQASWILSSRGGGYKFRQARKKWAALSLNIWSESRSKAQNKCRMLHRYSRKFLLWKRPATILVRRVWAQNSITWKAFGFSNVSQAPVSLACKPT